MKEIDPLHDQEPGTPRWQGSLADAMARRDTQLEEAVAALRAAADSAAINVDTLMCIASPDARLRPARQAPGTAAERTGFVSLAQQLQDIAFQLRVLDSAVRRVLERHRS
ncbi:hypothetical protein M2165_000402 [Variovorax sp. TBS-050B]|uniref:hypothetical protein n=1 Tax=Variovorax sp. TBS-050B TaxID=2940551 RepID=UPI002472F3C8|nr:hypothetical protein [Variovorax sp. TBS-050B]MDH6590513.1 hypothetical protein [Variovorax sp. TBS-050B]